MAGKSGPAKWSEFTQGYAGTQYGDASAGGVNSGDPSNGNVTWARDQKFYRLALVGPDGKLHTLGLMEGFDENEATNSDYIDVACTDQLEWELGTPRWTFTLQRMQPRGADMRQMMLKIYPGITTVDWRFLPFILQGAYNYLNPTAVNSKGDQQSYENAMWNYHKCFVRNYRNIPVPGTKGKMREEVDIVGAGYSFFENGTRLIQTNPYAYSGQFFTASSGNIASNNSINAGP